jgi:hypothetical protein
MQCYVLVKIQKEVLAVFCVLQLETTVGLFRWLQRCLLVGIVLLTL